MKEHFNHDQLLRDRMEHGLRGHSVASTISQAISVGGDRVFYTPTHTGVVGVEITEEELRLLLKEVEQVRGRQSQ